MATKKGHTASAPLQFVIIARNVGGQKVGSLGSTHDMDRTKRQAQSLLRLTPAASYADIYAYAGTGEEAKGKYEGDSIERVSREEQGAAQ